jgi:glycosyltransferase involved in cell wall biosynthesis
MVKRHLTIIIPCKNEEGYIDKTLLSLNKQLGIDGTKVIILDANSTDNTIKIIKEIKKK